MKKGFTLIELLAVIVILAIIAVIAVPIVLDIINDTKESSNVRSGDFYLSAVDNAIMQYKLNNNKKYVPSSCLIKEDGNLLCDELYDIQVEVDGEKPDGGTIFFTKGKITTSELVFGQTIIRSNEEGTLINVENSTASSNNSVVYFDVATGKSCKESDYNVSNSKTGYNGIDNKSGNQNSCLKFYKLGEEGSNVNLLLDHNTKAMIAWNTSIDNINMPPNEVLIELKSNTKDWKVTTRQDKYKTSGYPNSGYQIDYTGYKARLITMEEVASLTAKSDWNETEGNSFYFFSTQNRAQSETCKEGNTSGCPFRWLYDRTSMTCKSTGCLNNASSETSNNESPETYGYWTATYKSTISPQEGHSVCSGFVKYGVSYMGRLGYACSDNKTHYGVRPVITVSKNDI